MTGKERVQGVIERTFFDRIPLYCEELFVNTAGKWREQGMPPTRTEQEDFFDYDFTEMFIDSSWRFEERLLDENEESRTIADKYGFVATRNKIIPGIRYLEHPVKTYEDWLSYRECWNVSEEGPSRLHEISYFVPFVEWPTWKEARAIFDRKRSTGRHITLITYGLWEILWRLKGYNEAMMDLVLNCQMVEEIFESYVSFLLDVLRMALKHGIRPDSFFLLDDYGEKNGLLFSPALIRKLLFPQIKRIGGFLRTNNIYFFLHSCGAIQQLIPDFLELGIVGLNPLQATVMDVVNLKEIYGDRLTFIGNINARTMHDKTIVFPEIRRKLPIASRGGGYVFCSDHSIPETMDLQTYLDILAEVKAMPVIREGLDAERNNH